MLAGAAQVWHVYVFALALGVVTAFDAPARQTYVTSLVPPEDLPNAIGLNAATFHLGRLLGPASAGLLIAWAGTGPVFLINAVSFAFTVAVLAMTRTRSPGQGTQRAQRAGADARGAVLRPHPRRRPARAVPRVRGRARSGSTSS